MITTALQISHTVHCKSRSHSSLSLSACLPASCHTQSAVIPPMITAAVDILGGVGADYVKSGKCANGPPAAFLKMHGVKDPFITYDKQV